MDVRCEKCRAQYVFDDEQVTPSGLTVQCTNCGHVFKVKKKELVVTVPVKPGEMEGAPLPATAAAPRPGAAHAPATPPAPVVTHGSLPAPPAAAPHGEPERPREWRVRQANGNIFTFRELTTLQKWIIEQKVSRDDEISLSGDQWKRLGNIAELASFFQVVEAAERSRSYPLPAVAPMPPLPLPPAPRYGAGPDHRRTAAPNLPPPMHEVDLGPDVERLPPKRPRRGGAWAVAVLLLGALGAGGYVYGPALLAAPPPPGEAAAPITIAPAPEPPPPPPEAEPAPAPPPEPVKPAAPKGPKALLAQAARLLERGDAEAALELYGRVASGDPENTEALTGRGLCYLDLENFAPAEASFSAALRIDPGEAGALLGLAETYRSQGKKSEAISHYERYLAQHPDGDEVEVARNALAELR
jgi:predicted Zn finger-like uncharacterized protein